MMKPKILKPSDFYEGLKVIKNNPKTRQQLSNPHAGLSHSELLERAGVQKFTDYEIEELENGRIKIHPKL